MATDVIAQNPRGIPKAPFVDLVENFIENGQVEPLLRKFNDLLSMYKRMEISIQQRQINLESKLPELKKALKAVELLKKQKEADQDLKVNFECCDSLYVKATIPKDINSANVMIEYTLDEAIKLLTEKSSMAEQSKKVVNDDLQFLREQITTMEVNIARVYNWDVKQRKMKDTGK